MKTSGVMLAVIAMLLGGRAAAGDAATHRQRESNYAPSSMCAGCHDKIVAEHMQSGHENSFLDPVFQAQYFRELLPQVSRDGRLEDEARQCIACHSPIAYLKRGGRVSSREDVAPEMSGVTCDLCHTISGYKNGSPGNGNFLSTPGQDKLGPFHHDLDWHHRYGALQTKSEFCAICHRAVNHRGLEVKATYTEWQNSPYRTQGIECQDCHMTLHGFLTGGKPTYDSGHAARMTIGQAPFRPRLHTHRFAGARSRSQVVGAIALRIEADGRCARPGSRVTIRVLIDNERTGHKMPSGSADLRQLWLSLQAEIGQQTVAIPAGSQSRVLRAFDVVGRGEWDLEILGEDIPKGSRIYRAVFLDETGKQTLASYKAVKILFDNRLEASEIREEKYQFIVPADAKGSMALRATLYYLPYPSSFADRLGLPRAEPVVVASHVGEVTLQ